MTLYQDEQAYIAGAEAKAGKAAKRKSRKVWALAAVGTVFAGGAAFAAVQLFGFGSIDASAATLKNLNVQNAHLTGTLAPGQTVGGAADVGNENDFPVKVTGVILQDSSLQTTGGGCDPATVSPGGTPVASYPGAGGGAGHLVAITPVTIPAGQAVTVTAANVVSQTSTAGGLCGVKANFAIVATVGN